LAFASAFASAPRPLLPSSIALGVMVVVAMVYGKVLSKAQSKNKKSE
jgi:hypothetical protein